MKKRISILMLVMVILLTACGTKDNNKSSDAAASTGGNAVKADGYYYAEENLLEEGQKALAIASSDQEFAYMVASKSDKEASNDETSSRVDLHIKDKEGNKSSLSLVLNGMVQSFAITEEKIAVLTSSKEGSQLAVYDRSGKLLNSATLSSDSEGVEAEDGENGDMMSGFYGSSLVGIVGDAVIMNDGMGYVKIDMATGEQSPFIKEALQSAFMFNGNFYALKHGKQSSLMVYDATTGAEVKALNLPKGVMAQTFVKSPKGFTAIDYEQNIYQFDENMTLLEKVSLSESGPKRFMKNSMLNSVMGWNGKLQYTVAFDMSIVDMASNDSMALEFNGFDVFELSRKEGENPQTAGMKEIVVYSHKMDYILNLYAKEFMGKNDNVKITIKTFDDLSRADYIKKINTDLIAGTSIDLVNLNDVPADKLVKKGFFKELTSSISDEEKASYYKGILSAIQYKDNIYGLPIMFSPEGFYMNADIMNNDAKAYVENPSIENFKAMLASYENSDIKVFRKLEDKQILKLLLNNQLAHFVDFSKTNPITKEGLDELLDTVEAIKTKHMNNEMGRDEYVYYGTKGKVLSEVAQTLQTFDLGYIKELLSKNYVLAPFPSQDGGFSGSADTYGIPKDSKHQEIALAFIKFLSSNEQVQDSVTMMGLNSVNATSLTRYQEKLKKEAEEGMITMGAMAMPEQTKYGTKNIQIVDPTDNDYKAIQDAYNKTTNINVYNRNVRDMIISEIENHYKTSSSRDELLSSLNNKLFLYYNE